MTEEKLEQAAKILRKKEDSKENLDAAKEMLRKKDEEERLLISKWHCAVSFTIWDKEIAKKIIKIARKHLEEDGIIFESDLCNI